MILTTVYKKTLGNFVEFVPGKPGNLRKFCVGNWVDTLIVSKLQILSFCLDGNFLSTILLSLI